MLIIASHANINPYTISSANVRDISIRTSGNRMMRTNAEKKEISRCR